MAHTFTVGGATVTLDTEKNYMESRYTQDAFVPAVPGENDGENWWWHDVLHHTMAETESLQASPTMVYEAFKAADLVSAMKERDLLYCDYQDYRHWEEARVIALQKFIETGERDDVLQGIDLDAVKVRFEAICAEVSG